MISIKRGEMLAKEISILTRAQAKTEIEDYVQGECALMSDDMVVNQDAAVQERWGLMQRVCIV